jgi:hypothetical protein
LKKILILWHEREERRGCGILIRDLAKLWRDRGLQVSEVYGTRDRPEADLLIPHVDLTHTPPEYIEYIQSFPVAVNREVFDISKRRISQHLLRGDEDYRGPVIVKTDNNFGGWPECRLSRRGRRLLAQVARYVARLAAYAPGQSLAWRSALVEYTIYRTLAEVPPGAFRNSALVVERFLPEREGDRYFMRLYFFLGDRARNVRIAGHSPLLKRQNAMLVEEGIPVPEPVLRLRSQLGLDYGKIDYAIHEGEVVIFDVNRTPGGPSADDEHALYLTGWLADGIWSLLPQ